MGAVQGYNVGIACIVDQKHAGEANADYPIIRVDQLKEYDFDDVIVCSFDYAREIEAILERFAVETGKKFRIHNIALSSEG